MAIQSTKLVSFVSLLLPICASFLFAEEPATIGSSCSGDSTVYQWMTSSRTKWSVAELYAVPTGILDPADWPDAPAFRTRMLQVLPQNANAEAYATSCSSVWSEFFTGRADAIVLLKRTITATKRKVECVSGLWSIISQSEGTTPDDSQWLRLGDTPYDVPAPSSGDLLKANLLNLLNTLNGQPGADIAPVESFVSLQQ